MPACLPSQDDIGGLRGEMLAMAEALQQAEEEAVAQQALAQSLKVSRTGWMLWLQALSLPFSYYGIPFHSRMVEQMYREAFECIGDGP
jgi:hypothetical protein